MPYTYRDIIRHYADDLRKGLTDTDLTPRQRKVCAVILATASNDGRASVTYPPTDETRTDIARALGNALWNGNASALAESFGPSALSDYGAAYDRALEILRNI